MLTTITTITLLLFGGSNYYYYLREFEITIHYSSIFYQKGGFYIRYDIPMNDLPTKYDFGENINARWEEIYTNFEIVGNQQENPELLKQ